MRGKGHHIGLLGGTFDPPHNGHLVAAVNVRHALGLERMVLVPAGVPWQKADERSISDGAHRLAMTRLLIEGVEGLEVSTVELDRAGDTYTADTLEALTAPGDVTVHLVVGSDVAAGLDTWKRPEVVRRLARTVVYERPGALGSRPPAGWPHEVVDVPLLDVSSTDLRDRVATGRPIEGLTPAAVVAYVRRHGLYGSAA